MSNGQLSLHSVTNIYICLPPAKKKKEALWIWLCFRLFWYPAFSLNPLEPNGETLRPPELAAALSFHLQLWKQNIPPPASQVDKVDIDRWTSHVKIAYLGTDQFFWDRWLYIYICSYGIFLEKVLCTDLKSTNIGQLPEKSVCFPVYTVLRNFPLNDNPPP